MKKKGFSARSITIIITSIIVVFGIAAAFSWKQAPPPTREGYKQLAGMEGPITKTDFNTILNECVTNIANNETILSALDKNYKASTVSVDSNASDMDNIKNILSVMKKQDTQIFAMLPSYLPNKDLDGLMDGSLLTPVTQDLYNQSNIPENPLDCNPVAIQKAIDGFKVLLSQVQGSDTDANNKRMMYNGSISQYQSKLVELAAVHGMPGNTKCVPKLSQADAEGILNGFYMNSIVKILKSQAEAVKAIQANTQSKISDFYSVYLK